VTIKNIKVPDIGEYENVEVIELSVSVGDVIEEEDSLITLETDKASMEIPSPLGGKIVEILISEGDKVSEGDVIIKLESQSKIVTPKKETLISESTPPTTEASVIDVKVPDIGDYSDVDVIEVSVALGDEIEEEDSLITLETDKASMEIPSPFSGKIIEMTIKDGDKVSEGDIILKLSVAGTAQQTPVKEGERPVENNNPSKTEIQPSTSSHIVVDNSKVSATPSVRRLARILNVDLSRVSATGRKGRITKDDCYNYIKNAVTALQSGSLSAGNGLDLLPMPEIDFTKFGKVEEVALTRINKLSAKNLARNWVVAPHVTFYDKADVTDLEEFRKSKKAYAEKLGVKITPLAFQVKAAASALKEYPKFNSSLSNDGEKLFIKKYINIGFATDTPSGLVVPVVKDADKKGILEISQDIIELSTKGRNGKISPADMSGATFTISSVGILGTNSFTPIINLPEVAIMGSSKLSVEPVWNGKEFEPRTMLPLSLSTDHRVIDGAYAAKFLTRYCQLLGDLREVIL